jgi:hypothetical protein
MYFSFWLVTATAFTAKFTIAQRIIIFSVLYWNQYPGRCIKSDPRRPFTHRLTLHTISIIKQSFRNDPDCTLELHFFTVLCFFLQKNYLVLTYPYLRCARCSCNIILLNGKTANCFISVDYDCFGKRAAVGFLSVKKHNNKTFTEPTTKEVFSPRKHGMAF